MIGNCVKCNQQSVICERCQTCNECHIDNFLDHLSEASTNEMNGLSQTLISKGGKFKLLAEVLMGLKSVNDPEWNKYTPGDSL